MEAIKTQEGQAPQSRTFTQEEVNKIVSERLAKERSRLTAGEHAQESAYSQREQALSARESRLACLEYLRQQGLREELLEVLDTRDAEDFRTRLAKLLEICPALDERITPPAFSLSTQQRADAFSDDPFAQAFGRK